MQSNRQQDAERENRKQKTEPGHSCQHSVYKQGDEPSWLPASGCKHGSLTRTYAHICTHNRGRGGTEPGVYEKAPLDLRKAETKSWVGDLSARQEEKRPLSFPLWSHGEKWNNIVAGSAPGSARGQTARGGWEFMKTAEDVAAMAGFKCFSSNLKGGLCPSELVLTCCSSPLYWHLSRLHAFLSVFL